MARTKELELLTHCSHLWTFLLKRLQILNIYIYIYIAINTATIWLPSLYLSQVTSATSHRRFLPCSWTALRPAKEREGLRAPERKQHINMPPAPNRKLGLLVSGRVWWNLCSGCITKAGKLHTQCHAAARFQSADTKRKLFSTVTPSQHTPLWRTGEGRQQRRIERMPILANKKSPC